jgi:hypothetical protein
VVVGCTVGHDEGWVVCLAWDDRTNVGERELGGCALLLEFVTEECLFDTEPTCGALLSESPALTAFVGFDGEGVSIGVGCYMMSVAKECKAIALWPDLGHFLGLSKSQAKCKTGSAFGVSFAWIVDPVIGLATT